MKRLPSYSIARALKCALEHKPTGYEGEIHQELTRLEPHTKNFRVPWAALIPGVDMPGEDDELKRFGDAVSQMHSAWQAKIASLVSAGKLSMKAQTIGNATSGGFLTETLVPLIGAALRPHSVALDLGAHLLNVDSHARIPRLATGASAYWLGETEECPESNLTLGNFNPSAHRCASWLKVSNQLLIQSGLANAMLMRDLRAAIASALDLGIFSGVGGSEPVGLLNQSDIPKVAFGAAPTRAKLASFERALGDENANDLEASWVTSPAVREKWRTTLNDSVAGSGYLWDDSNRVLGHPARATNNVTEDRAIFGVFSELLILTYGAIELADPYTPKKSNETEFLVEIRADAGPIQPKSFVVSSDDAAQ